MYGREGELNRLNRDRNDYSLSKIVRRRADLARGKILSQMKDKKLMRMRLQLIKATVAEDVSGKIKLQHMMRHYLKEDMETGQ